MSLRVSVAMVTSDVTKMTATCSRMIGHLFDIIIIVAALFNGL